MQGPRYWYLKSCLQDGRSGRKWESCMSGSALHLTGCRTSGKTLPWLGLRFLYCEMKRSPRSMISQTVFLWAPGSEEVILGTKAVVSGKWKEFQLFKHSSAMRSYILNFSLWLCWKKDFDSKINKMETISVDDFKQHFPQCHYHRFPNFPIRYPATS